MALILAASQRIFITMSIYKLEHMCTLASTCTITNVPTSQN